MGRLFTSRWFVMTCYKKQVSAGPLIPLRGQSQVEIERCQIICTGIHQRIFRLKHDFDVTTTIITALALHQAIRCFAELEFINDYIKTLSISLDFAPTPPLDQSGIYR